MDNKTLRALVVEYKDDDMTYQEISDKLAEEHGVIRSRQALQGMYQRAIKRKDTEDMRDRIVAKADIVNIYCLGYSRTEIQEIVNNMGYDLNYNDIITTINEQEEYIEQVEATIVNRLEGMLIFSDNINDLKESLIYKEMEITDKKLNEYMVDAYTNIARDKIHEVLASAYRFTDDTIMARKIARRFNIDFSIGDIKDKI